MRVLVTGGCGYIGSILVPKLLLAGHKVTVVDLLWFGSKLEPHPDLAIYKEDYRKCEMKAEAVIHLANIANDPAGELDPKLTWEVNALGMAQAADKAVRAGVKQFIYASSGSVYGVSDVAQVTEKTPLVPLTEYNKSKMVAERVLLSYADKMVVQIVRPGTVCGFSPRQRLDITVNSLVASAFTKGRIELVGAKQNRPNVHIEDITDLFLWLLERPEMTGIWNAGFENLTGMEIAKIVSRYFGGLPIDQKDSPDRRSYRMNSDKLLKAGFQPQHTVEDAVVDLAVAFDSAQLEETDECHNIRTMKILQSA